MTIAARFVLKALERLSVGGLTLHLPDGTTHRFGSEGAKPQAELHVRDRRFFRRVLLDGDIGFTLAGWPTVTTRERINGILTTFGYRYWGVAQRDHAQYLVLGGEKMMPLGDHDHFYLSELRAMEPLPCA